ncbi:MAG: protein translocase subunit SecF, partial [Chloroflexi bacterium]|nr:protein translocase subunit SecF [Chloroflexota bacterium]
MTVAFSQPVDEASLRQEMANLNHPEAVIQKTGEGTFLIRTKTLRGEVKDAEGKVVQPAERQVIEDALQAKFGTFVREPSFESVSPVIASQIVKNAFWAVLAATVGILLYISWAFRQMPQPFRYGTCAVIALIHDVLVVVGLFSIFGKVFGIEVDSMFITALLTIIGFSVHDTIVVFDRIRENLGRGVSRDFGTTVNNSILETLGRSINTSMTVVLTLLALYLFGGVTIRHFTLVLLIGIISGTYSSIFNASQFLVVWEYGELRKLWPRRLSSVANPEGRR